MERASIKRQTRRNTANSTSSAADPSVLQHQHVLDEFSAASLNEHFIPETRLHELEMSAASERITYHEWLHGRAMSRVGLVGDEGDGPSAHAAPDSRPKTPLFKLTLGNGGDWDW